MLAKYNCNIFRKQDGRTIATNEERQKEEELIKKAKGLLEQNKLRRYHGTLLIYF